jgi:hypothetical protein
MRREVGNPDLGFFVVSISAADYHIKRGQFFDHFSGGSPGIGNDRGLGAMRRYFYRNGEILALA